MYRIVFAHVSHLFNSGISIVVVKVTEGYTNVAAGPVV